jgi:hypothetical protein
MALYQFKNFSSSNIGTSPITLYTPPSGKKSMALGLSISNLTSASLPVEIYITKSNADVIHLSKSSRVAGGESVDFLEGRKSVLEDGDSIGIESQVGNAFDALLSVMEDID